MKIFAAGFIVASAFVAPAAPCVTLEPLWTTRELANPESVIADGDALYVSNVDGEGDAKDGKGFVAKLDRAGKVVEREWVAGLDGPKGMALRDGRLYVADITALVVVDVASRKVAGRHEAPEAKFLNDVAIAKDGAVLVADSGSARILSFRDGAFEVWLAGDELRAVNGLLPEPDRLVVTTMAGKLLAIDWQTRAITVLASDLGNADGVAPLADGHYLVGEWPGRLFDVAPDGTHVVLRDTRETKPAAGQAAPAKEYQNDFLKLGDTLLVPNWEPSTLTAYRVVD